MANKIIGREYEQRLIRTYNASNKAELVAVYGRRRVGKTFLIKNTIGDELAFSFTGIYKASRATQLKEFAISLESYSGHKCQRPEDWYQAFHILGEYLETLDKERIVVFLDELPWMDTPKGDFIGAFGRFWNDWGSERDNFKLYVCGSATTWMVSKFIGDKGGLYGRVCRPIHLAPFNLKETEMFLKEVKGMELSRKQIVDTYMIMGGIPYYLDMLIKGMPLNRNIDDLFFREHAPLRDEYSFLFRSLFKDSQVYQKVIELLAGRMTGMSRQEILTVLKMKEGGNLTEILANLVSCDFIRKYQVVGKKERDAVYVLTDNFSLFHIRFVSDNNSQDENYWSNIDGKPVKNTWSGFAFEQVCLQHISQIKEALGISGILSTVYSWSSKPYVDKEGIAWKGGQIDLLIDRSDNVINICEIKYVTDKYAISSEYEERLRHRASLFLNVTGTRKALQHIFITTYGIQESANSHIVQNDLTMDALFGR